MGLYTYAVFWSGIGTIITVLVANHRGYRGAALLVWVVLGAALGVFAILLALAGQGSGDGSSRSFRLTKES
jgi:hypothetical protein